MQAQTEQIIQKFLQFLTQRKIDELTDLFSDTVDWYIPGDIQKAPWLGKRNSKEQVKAFYELLWKNTEPVSAQIDKIITDQDTAIITGEFSTKMLQTGNIVDSPFSIQITVSDGQIVKYRLLEDSYAVSVAMRS